MLGTMMDTALQRLSGHTTSTRSSDKARPDYKLMLYPFGRRHIVTDEINRDLGRGDRRSAPSSDISGTTTGRAATSSVNQPAIQSMDQSMGECISRMSDFRFCS